MPSALTDFLGQRAKGQTPDGFVAQAMKGGMLEQKKFYNGLQALCKQADVKIVSPHGIRHSCTEIWVSHGANLEDLRRQLNHKSIETTQRYVHRSEERLLLLAEKISAPTPSLKAVP